MPTPLRPIYRVGDADIMQPLSIPDDNQEAREVIPPPPVQECPTQEYETYSVGVTEEEVDYPTDDYEEGEDSYYIENTYIGNSIPIERANRDGMLRIGIHIASNGDLDSFQEWYRGIITDIAPAYFTVARTDGMTGSGHEGGWLVSRNSSGKINFISKTCALCGKKAHATINESPLCETCLRKTVECRFCGKLTIAYDECCKDCWEDLYAVCNHCWTHHQKSKLVDGFCPKCLKNTILCEDCGKRIFLGEHCVITSKDDKKVCIKCYRNNYFECTVCYGQFDREDKAILPPMTNNVSPLSANSQLRRDVPVPRSTTLNVCKRCYTIHYGECDVCHVHQRTNKLYFKGNNSKRYCHICIEQSKPLIRGVNARSNEVAKIGKILVDKKRAFKRYNTYKMFDAKVDRIAYRVGMVKYPILIYGISNEHNHDIRISPDLKDVVKPLLVSGFVNKDGDETLCVETPIGLRRVNIISNVESKSSVGLSTMLRGKYLDWCCRFIKSINKRLERVNRYAKIS
jgi:hypothetical protein